MPTLSDKVTWLKCTLHTKIVTHAREVMDGLFEKPIILLHNATVLHFFQRLWGKLRTPAWGVGCITEGFKVYIQIALR